jgi:predicted transposase/invertase (TIGR01784 family)
VFKKLMTAEEDILRSFLSAALALDASELSELSVHDPHVSADAPDAKLGILDVRVRTAHGTMIDIEVQMAPSSGLVERVIFYLCSLLTRQIRRGGDYRRLHRAVSIVITGFALTAEPSFANYYSLRNDRTSGRLSDIIQVCVLELPKVGPTDTGALSDWMRFLSSQDEAELEALAARDGGIGKAVDMLKYMSREESLQVLEQSYEKYEWDMANRMDDARAEGLAKGLAEGEARGEYEGTLRVARAALAKGMATDLVREITGLDAEAIRRLREN